MRTKETNSEIVLQIVATNIMIARTKAGISQKDLSRIIGKKDDFIERLESFKLKRLTTDTALMIAIVLNVSFDSLLTFDDICEKIIY